MKSLTAITTPTTQVTTTQCQTISKMYHGKYD